MDGVITLTTDFGVDDTYVGVVKGVTLKINPQARIIDLSHSVQPQNIIQAGFLLHNSFRYFPLNSIHLAVVDPGVGTDRKAVILKVAHPPVTFVAPDNGLLSFILAEHMPQDTPEPLVKDGQIALRELVGEFQAYDISQSRFWLNPVSPTFHARDIFAPVVAYLSLGYSPSAFGQPVSSLVYHPPPRPVRGYGGVLKGRVIHIDHFGNLVTNIERKDLPGGDVNIEIGGQRIGGLKFTYAEGDHLMALIGSSGFLEIALREGSAAGFLKAKIGDDVIVKPV